MLVSPRLDARRLRASILLFLGWLLPAAASCAFFLHEIEHSHPRASRARVETILHGHLHSEAEPPHTHDLVAWPDPVRTAFRPGPIAPPATSSSLSIAPVRASTRASGREDDPDPGGPGRQAVLRVFRT